MAGRYHILSTVSLSSLLALVLLTPLSLVSLFSTAPTYAYGLYAENQGDSNSFAGSAETEAVSGSSLVFAPAADATVKSGSPKTNYGSKSKLELDNSPLGAFCYKVLRYGHWSLPGGQCHPASVQH